MKWLLLSSPWVVRIRSRRSGPRRKGSQYNWTLSLLDHPLLHVFQVRGDVIVDQTTHRFVFHQFTAEDTSRDDVQSQSRHLHLHVQSTGSRRKYFKRRSVNQTMNSRVTKLANMSTEKEKRTKHMATLSLARWRKRRSCSSVVTPFDPPSRSSTSHFRIRSTGFVLTGKESLSLSSELLAFSLFFSHSVLYLDKTRPMFDCFSGD